MVAPSLGAHGEEKIRGARAAGLRYLLHHHGGISRNMRTEGEKACAEVVGPAKLRVGNLI
jgi:hypothetical protein